MARQAFTVSRVDGFFCEPGKSQSIYWDSKAPGLGLRVTASGVRSYIFESRLFGKTIRTTIGDSRAWELGKARAEAMRLKTLIDDGKDPRELRAEQKSAHEARQAAAKRQDATFGDAWDAYVEARKPFWSDRHYQDHQQHAAIGGQPRKRGKGVTDPGPLANLRSIRLVELTGDCIAAWLQQEAANRPTMTALSFRLLRAFIRWTAETKDFDGLISPEAYKTRDVKDLVPRAKAKEGDVLQREQLAKWFEAIRAIPNFVLAVYLQGLLITGARREELAALRWENVDLSWRSVTLNDKVEGTGGRTIPLPPYLTSLFMQLKKRNNDSPWVFPSATSEDGKIAEPRIAHVKALQAAGLPHVSLHGLRRSFGTLSEWCEVPVGVIAQIQGHKPSAIAEKHYRRRPLDLLRKWHDQIEAWMLEQAGIKH